MIATPKYFYHQDADVRSEMIRNHLQEELGMPVKIWYPDIFILQDGNWQEYGFAKVKHTHKPPGFSFLYSPFND